MNSRDSIAVLLIGVTYALITFERDMWQAWVLMLFCSLWYLEKVD